MLKYVTCKTGDSPPDNAVQGGYDDGPSYHARGVVGGKMIPGKAGVRCDTDRRFVGACIPYGSRENRIHSFEVLTVEEPSRLSYVRCKTGDLLPDNAVKGGYDDGPSYHARGVVAGKTIPGKVGSPSASNMVDACIPYASREHRIRDFEVLVKTDAIAACTE